MTTVKKQVRFIETPSQDSAMSLFEVWIDGELSSFKLEGHEEHKRFDRSFDNRKEAEEAYEESVQYYFAERISSQLDRKYK